jgi:hypothetical protein
LTSAEAGLVGAEVLVLSLQYAYVGMLADEWLKT